MKNLFSQEVVEKIKAIYKILRIHPFISGGITTLVLVVGLSYLSGLAASSNYGVVSMGLTILPIPRFDYSPRSSGGSSGFNFINEQTEIDEVEVPQSYRYEKRILEVIGWDLMNDEHIEVIDIATGIQYETSILVNIGDRITAIVGIPSQAGGNTDTDMDGFSELDILHIYEHYSADQPVLGNTVGPHLPEELIALLNHAGFELEPNEFTDLG